MAKEIEVKFQIANLGALTRALKRAGFKQVTPSTHEINALYDLSGQKLRRRGQLLRLRKYGDRWVLTHKSKSTAGRYKRRLELETRVENGEQMDAILRALGYAPTLRYEKYRAEWTDGNGHVVLDQTPIGVFGEIEGTPRWIDRTARALRIQPADYITQTYAGLYLAHCRRQGLPPADMLFQEGK